jgi:hypothetical protein
MHAAAKFQFERVAREFAQWRAVPEGQRIASARGVVATRL